MSPMITSVPNCQERNYPMNGPLYRRENWENADNSLTAGCILHRITSDNWSTTNGHVTPPIPSNFRCWPRKSLLSLIRVLSCVVAGSLFAF